MEVEDIFLKDINQNEFQKDLDTIQNISLKQLDSEGIVRFDGSEGWRVFNKNDYHKTLIFKPNLIDATKFCMILSKER